MDHSLQTIIFVVSLIATLSSCKTLDSREDSSSSSTCTYAFTVPKGEGEECLPCCDGETDNSSIAALQEFLSNQYQTLAEKLDNIASKLDLGGNDDDEDNGNGNQGGSTNSSGIGGTNYVHWGRTTCPDTAQFIYDGFMGKSHYSHGGGVNYLCLPAVPDFPDNAAEGLQSQSYIYGVEYERHNSPLIESSMHDQDAPCAVCEVKGRSQKLMIPAKTTCPDDWTKEYQGLLMAQHYTHHESDFVCIADDMEALPRGSANANGGLLYVVEGVCGSLPCPPYVNGYELTCVLCTK